MCEGCPPTKGYDYALAYQGTPGVKVSMWDFCNKCKEPMRMIAETVLHQNEQWSPSLTCLRCGNVKIVTITLGSVFPSRR